MHVYSVKGSTSDAFLFTDRFKTGHLHFAFVSLIQLVFNTVKNLKKEKEAASPSSTSNR